MGNETNEKEGVVTTIPPPPFHLFRYTTYLSLSKRSDGSEEDDLHQQRSRSPDVSDREEQRGELDQRLGVLVEKNSVVAEAVAQSAEGDPVRIVGGGIGLQPVHGPHVVEHESRDVQVGASSPAVSHLSSFVFFIVSKERVSKKL